jgi:hypothetical protein
MKRTLLVLSTLALLGAACTDDPVYLQPDPRAVEVGGEGGAATGIASITLPFRVETMEETTRRVELAESLMLDPSQVPTIRRDLVDVELEWSVKNLDAEEGTAVITAVGANEYFSYDPAAFIIDPEEDEAPPPLLGGIPVIVPPQGTVSGVFREDELWEAAQDLDALTRSGVTPERAMLTQWISGDIVDDATGMLLMPSEAVPALLRLDVTFAANRHMVLEYVVRVRDHSDRLAIDETDPGRLVQPAAQGSYVPPPPPAP